MKGFRGLLVLSILISVALCQSIGLETYKMELQAAGNAPLLSCPANNEIEGCIYSITTTTTKFVMYTLTNEDYDAVPLNWTSVDAQYFPLCAEAADEQDAFMLHFHDGVCELSLKYGYARDAEPSDLTGTKTVYINEALPQGACRLGDGTAIADGTCSLVALKGCSKVEVLATCDGGSPTYDPNLEVDVEYFELEGNCATLAGCDSCPGDLQNCYPTSAETVTSFVDTLKGQLEGDSRIAVRLAYNFGNSVWVWNFDLDYTFDTNAPEWAQDYPIVVDGPYKGFVTADGIVNDDPTCIARTTDCCMLLLDS